MRINRVKGAMAIALAGALGLSACSDSDRDDGGGDNADTKDVFVFAASADPVTLDPAFASDGETFRVARQVFEGLVDLKAGSNEIGPKLAESWETEDSQTWTFKLRDGVKFTDGTDFNAEAVCANFDRWYNWSGPLLQASAVSQYWQTVFGGFKKNDVDTAPKTNLYSSCEASDELTAVINLAQPFASFLPALTLPPFAMQSPTAMQQYEADKVSGTADSPEFAGTYWNAHPTGTGPYKFSKWEPDQQVELLANDDYWGEKAKTPRLVFKTVSDNNDRRQQLEGGEIDGYDNADAADFQALRDGGFSLAERDPTSLGYIGFNQAKPPMDNPKIRQAIAHAINREALVKAKYPEGAEVAKEFMPPSMDGYEEDVTTYDYNPDEAKKLIRESGVTDLTIEFAYPTDVSRPYMPNPLDNWTLMKADLEAVGFKITPRSAQWSPDYLDQYQSGAYQMWIVGWNADYPDADNFLGTFFRADRQDFAWNDKAIQGELTDALAEDDPAARTDLYKQANKKIMEELPALPYVIVGSFIALDSSVEGFVPNPYVSEDFSKITVR